MQRVPTTEETEETEERTTSECQAGTDGESGCISWPNFRCRVAAAGLSALVALLVGLFLVFWSPAHNGRASAATSVSRGARDVETEQMHERRAVQEQYTVYSAGKYCDDGPFLWNGADPLCMSRCMKMESCAFITIDSKMRCQLSATCDTMADAVGSDNATTYRWTNAIPRDACDPGWTETAQAGNSTRVVWVNSTTVKGTLTEVAWLKSLTQENCSAACARAGLVCEETAESWPASQADVASIALGLGKCCKNFTPAEQPFDPSISGSFCSSGLFRLSSVWESENDAWRRWSLRSCEAIPPLGTTRFCPCAKQVKKLECESCSPTCWQRDNCCANYEDPCAQDPMVQRFKWKKDPKWWGFGKVGAAHGVPADAWCQQGLPHNWRMPEMWPYTGEVAEVADAVSVKVLTYNLYWWKLFGVKYGNDGSAGKLIASASDEEPFDLMGFQECEDPGRVLTDAGLFDNYTFFLHKPRAACIAFRTSDWTILDHGHKDVAEDGDWIRDLNFGVRVAMWVRLRHIASGRIVFFMNHHGPLPINTGGLCGGTATAFNLLTVIKTNAHKGDAVIVVGDFNADPTSLTLQAVASQLPRVYNGTKFLGVDNFLTNVNEMHITERSNYGGGGSDHDALGLTLELKSGVAPVSEVSDHGTETY